MRMSQLALLTSLLSAPLAAQPLENTWQVGVFGDYIKSSTHKETNAAWQQIEAGRGFGVDLQKVINDDWNARIELASSRYDVKDGNDKDTGLRYGLDAIYNIKNTGLYVVAGVKRFNNTKSYNAVNIGAGYNYSLNERFTLFSEANIYRDVDYGYTEQGFKMGVKYAFGDSHKPAIVNHQAPKAPATVPAIKAVPTIKKPVVLDTDSDGIIDSKDKCADTPAKVKVDSVGCALFDEHAVAINLKVSFETNSAKVKTSALRDIQRLADFMKAYPHTTVLIEGHSSADGSATYNLTLSQKRADAIKTMLINQYMIAANRLSAIGYGETQLIAKGNTAADHKINRRVIAKIETIVKKVISK